MNYHGILYIVATPIGNLEDITLRALRILKEVDFVVAEDTRRTKPMLTHYGIHSRLITYFEYSKERQADKILDLIRQGNNVALVSDAGTPTIADPGARLISQALALGISVIPVPGPSALMGALSVSGFPTDPFHFWGFLSPSNSKRRKVYEMIKTLPGSHAIYESPHKFMKRLEEWKTHFPDFYLFVGKEMTKKFETYWQGPFATVAEELQTADIRGEFTVIFSKEVM